MLMLVLSWTTLLLLNTTMLVVPASIGRAVFNAIPYPEDFNVIWHNDFYTISVGLYIMWKCIVTATKVVHCIKDRDVLLGPEIRKMGSTALKCLTLFFIWVSVIPLLSGFLLDLVTAPLVVPVDETQILFWHINWANGSLCLNIWLSMVGYQMIQDSERFQRLCTNLVLLEEHGLSHFTWSSAIGETIFSIISHLLTGLCVPYVFAKGIFPLFGYTVLANSVAYLYAWLGFLLLYMVWSCVAKLPSWVARVQNFIKDDRYVIGRRVYNYHV
ncbi:putative E3 ubiquitin ligase SUD1 isoform X2 [Carex rostrata]